MLLSVLGAQSPGSGPRDWTGLRSRVHLPTGGAGGAPRIWVLLCLLGYTLLKCLYSSGGGRSSIGWKLNFDSKSSMMMDLLRLEWPEWPFRMGGGGGGGPAGVLELREELELEEGGGGGLPMRLGSELWPRYGGGGGGASREPPLRDEEEEGGACGAVLRPGGSLAGGGGRGV